MKAFFSSISIAFLLVFGSCQGEASMSADGVAKQFSNIVSQLESVKDKASAETVLKAVSPLTDKLGTTMESVKKLGNVTNLLGDLTGKLGPIKDRLTKLMGGMTPDVGTILKPVVEKLMGFMPK